MGKTHSDYTLSDVIRLRPKWLMDKQTSVDDFQTQLNTLSQMMDYGFNHIASYPFLDTFGAPDISTLNMGDINKAIHEYAATQPVPMQQPDFVHNKMRLRELNVKHPELFTKTANGLDRTIRDNNRSIESRRENIDRANRLIREYERNILDNLEDMQRYTETNEALQFSLDNWSGGVDKERLRAFTNVPSHYRISRVILSGEKPVAIEYIRTKPVTANFTNSAAGINKTMYLGYFKIRLDIKSFAMRAGGFADNIVTNDSYTHPHLSSEVQDFSSICWGNKADTAQRLLAKKEVGKALQLLDVVLATYCPDAPYCRWSTFNRNKNTNRKAFRYKEWKNNRDALWFIYNQPETTQKFKDGFDVMQAGHKLDMRDYGYSRTTRLNKFVPTTKQENP